MNHANSDGCGPDGGIGRSELVGIAALFLLSFLIRLIGIGDQSLWLDEGYSLWFARHDIASIWSDVAKAEFNPPLFYMFLHGWISLFGEGPGAMRSMSALISALAVPMVYLTARWSFPESQSRLIAAVAGLLLALSYAQLQYAQEARAYSLCILSTSLVTAASARILCEIDESRTGRRAVWPFVLLGFGAALAIWSHYTMLVMIGLFAGFHLFAWAVYGRCSMRLVGAYGLSVLVFLVLAGQALWLLMAYAMPASAEFWISAPSLLDALDAGLNNFGTQYLLEIEHWGSSVLLRSALFLPWPILGTYVALHSRNLHERRAVVLLLIASLGCFLAYLIISWLGKPIFLQRIVLPSQIGWVILCALPVRLVRHERFRMAAAGLLVFIFASGAISYFRHRDLIAPKEPWLEIAQELGRHAGSEPHIYAGAPGKLLLEYYFHRLGTNLPSVVALNGEFRLPSRTAPFVSSPSNFAGPVSSEALEMLAADIESGAPVWIVMRNAENPRFEAVCNLIAQSQSTQRQTDILEPGPITIYRLNTGTAIAEEKT